MQQTQLLNGLSSTQKYFMADIYWTPASVIELCQTTWYKNDH